MGQVKKLYWSISEVSEMLNESYSTLRYWETEIKELQPKKNEGNTRFYTEKDIEILKQIQYMRDVEKMSIKMIRKKFADNKTDIEKKVRLRNYLLKMREQLVEIRSNL